MVSVGSVSVDVVPSAKGWVAKLRSQLLPEADALGLEIGRAISARINEALGNAHLTVDVDTAAADAQLGITEAIVNRLDGRTANVNVDADTAVAEAQLEAFGAGAGKSGRAFSGIGGAISSATSAMSPLIAAVGVLGLALIPVVATAAGLAAALVLPLAAAGGGIGLGAVLAGFAIKNVEKTAKKIDQLKAKAATLRDPKARAEALKEAADLEKSLTGPQKAFLTAQGHLSAAFAKLQTGKVGDALFAPLVAGMNLLAKVMPALAPIIESVSGAITGLLTSLSKSASGKGFTDFVAGFAKLAGATITSAGKSIALIGQGLFNIFRDFLPLSKSVGAGLTGLGQQFLDFSKKASTKQGIQSFINYVKANGPAVLSAIGNITVAFVRLGIALAPIGGKILGVITKIAQAFNKFPTGLATSILSPILTIGKAFTTVYNNAIGPFFQFIAKGIGLTIGLFAKFLAPFTHLPGAAGKWARDLADGMKNAAKNTKDLGDNLSHLPSPKVSPKSIQTTQVAAHGLKATLNLLSTGPTIRPKTDPKGLNALKTAAAGVSQSIAGLFKGKFSSGSGSIKVKLDASQVTAASKTATTLGKNMSKVGSTNTKLKVNKTQADAAATSVNKINTALGKIVSKKITVTVAYKAGPKPAGIATGGYIRGPGTGTSDSIPAMLSDGEYVINAKATKRNLDLLHRINSQGYATGGPAGSPASSSGSGDVLKMRIVNMGRNTIELIADDRIDARGDFAYVAGGMHR